MLLRSAGTLTLQEGQDGNVAATGGDVPDTEADVSGLASAVNYRPQVSVEEGVRRFVEWYKTYYGVGA